MYRFILSLTGFLILSNLSVSAKENFDIVTVSLKTSTYDVTKPPIFARVKYNKLCPLIITSDDMGGVELYRNWAFFNGYPVFDSKNAGHIPTGEKFLETPYSSSALSIQNQNMKRDSHLPLTYTDGTGGVRRFAGTSAIWPHHIENGNYTLLTKNDPLIMIRTGWSFAQHDVDNAYTTDASTIAGRFAYLSNLWASATGTGIGLKVLVEPAGDHKYIDAGKQSEEICWNIFQNGKEPDYPEMTNVLINDWTTGSDWTSFTNKPDATTRRIFFQGNEDEWKNVINNADGTRILIGGTHGIGDDILTFLKNNVQPTDKFWVASADEVWEYYHIYNHARIENINYTDGTLTFEIKVPQYLKHQFREMTINIPGVTDGHDYSFSDNVTVGAGKSNGQQYTLNIGIETNIYQHIEQLIAYYRAHLYNTYVKDDAQYLIDRLVDGDKKSSYQAQLDAEPNYNYKVIATSTDGAINKTLADDGVDAQQTIACKYQKYMLDANTNTLYQAQRNENWPYYLKVFTPSSKNEQINIDYQKAIDNVCFYCEGEDIPDAIVATEDYANINKNSGLAYALRYASNGAAGEVLSPLTITTLQPGVYTLVAALGDTHTSATATFSFKLGEKGLLTQTTEDVTGYVKEYSKEGIVVKTPQTLSVEAVNSGGSFWLDYVYLIKTANYDATAPDVELTTSESMIDVTNAVPTIKLTATATPIGDASITKTTIKDENGNTLAENNGNVCTYEYTPTQVGEIVFTAEGTDNHGKIGLSEDLTLTIKSDFILTATSNMGDNLGSIQFTSQTNNKTYRYLYPRFILKGTDLYETNAKSADTKKLHYGEELQFSMSNNHIQRTIEYNPVKTNIVFYAEGENIEGTRCWTWDNSNIDYNKGETYALTLGSMGKCGALTNITVTSLPKGKYKIFAGIGTTNSANYTFKLGDKVLTNYTPTTKYAINEFESEEFDIDEETPLIITCDKGKDNSQNWLDYIFIQKIGTIDVSITKGGFATFSSAFALDFTNSDIKAFIATVEDNQVIMTRINGTVPAATGLFLQGTIGEDVNEDIPLAGDIPPTIVNNALKAQLEDGDVEAGNYVFSCSADGTNLAFNRLTENTFMTAGCSYLSAPSLSNESINISFGHEITSILPISDGHSLDNNSIFTLDGLKWNDEPKGIYIKNGKKYVKKK